MCVYCISEYIYIFNHCVLSNRNCLFILDCLQIARIFLVLFFRIVSHTRTGTHSHSTRPKDKSHSLKCDANLLDVDVQRQKSSKPVHTAKYTNIHQLHTWWALTANAQTIQNIFERFFYHSGQRYIYYSDSMWIWHSADVSSSSASSLYDHLQWRLMRHFSVVSNAWIWYSLIVFLLCAITHSATNSHAKLNIYSTKATNTLYICIV